ncbi:hypothetical protein LO771_28260 [Streptacidiphilus sp. ASG 303]|uniref:hypothetical protein n=1 Tax=Streptacidiphilus sp. ASG 303 TaxID=2896847 RepID=UPI001E4624EB|nr:hypothetical protein [Streptacidiphilus sp. ASG 303]MCD0486172.1 hypothetical protein [Streptacidiphilus sp. ASG 303]
MGQPSWQDEKLGTMKRAALWLVQVVGEGNLFTKAQLREAFPGTSQIDRRMRDLRDFAWRIDTNREDLRLEAHEQRFVQMGEPVWEPGKATKSGLVPTATERRDLLARDGHMCRSCGITSGQLYAGTYEAAQLDVARRRVRTAAGSEEVQLVTECNRCRVGGRGLTADVGEVLARIDRLSELERRILAGWIGKDSRDFSALEQLWADYRTLPAEARRQVRSALS